MSVLMDLLTVFTQPQLLLLVAIVVRTVAITVCCHLPHPLIRTSPTVFSHFGMV